MSKSMELYDPETSNRLMLNFRERIQKSEFEFVKDREVFTRVIIESAIGTHNSMHLDLTKKQTFDLAQQLIAGLGEEKELTIDERLKLKNEADPCEDFHTFDSTGECEHCGAHRSPSK